MEHGLIIYISPLAKVIADLFASYCTPPNRKTYVSPSAIFIGGQMGGTTRPGPGTPRPGTPGHGPLRPDYNFVPCRAAYRANSEAQARHEIISCRAVLPIRPKLDRALKHQNI